MNTVLRLRKIKGVEFVDLELRPGPSYEDDREFWEVFALTLYRLSRCCFEVYWDGSYISFHLLVPRGSANQVANILKSKIKGEIIQGEPIDLSRFLGGRFRVWEGRLTRPLYVPLFKLTESACENRADVYVSALASTTPPSVLQLCIAPDPGALSVIGDYVYERTTGKSTSLGKILLDEIGSIITSSPETSPYREGYREFWKERYYARYGRLAVEDEATSQARKKMSMSILAVSLRFASKEPRDIDRLAAAFMFPYNSIVFSEGKVEDLLERKVRTSGLLFKDKKIIALSPKELASLLTLPSEEVLNNLPVKLGVVLLEPPPEVPKVKAPSRDIVVLGLWEHTNTYYGVRLNDFLRTHTAIFGSTGTGKSTKLKWLFKYIVEEMGLGLALLDPHGDLAYEVLKIIPEDRIEDLVYFDPLTAFEKKYGRVVKINFLEWKTPWEKGRIAEDFVTALKRLFGTSWGPRLEHILRNCVLTLVDQPPGSVSVLDLYNILVDENRREELVANVRDPIVKSFWDSEFPKLPKEALSSVINKLSPIVTSRVLRPIFSAKVSTVNLREVMDKGRILVINLGEYRVSGNLQAFLGTLLVGKLFTAAVQREELSPELRTPFFVIVDEAHNFITPIITKVLAETRKYKVFLILATQYPQQLPKSIRTAVYENAGNLIVFRVGKETAKELKKLFEPHLTEADLVNTANYWHVTRVAIGGKITRPFHLKNIYIPVELKGSNPFTDDPVISSRIKRSLERYGAGAEEEAPRYHIPVSPLEWRIILKLREGEIPLRMLDPDIVEFLYEKGYVEKVKRGRIHVVRLSSVGRQLVTFNPAGSPLHKKLILEYVKRLLDEGYYVIVDEEGAEAVPDIVAFKPKDDESWSDKLVCCEVEAYPDKSLTLKKLEKFSKKAEACGCCKLVIVVPEKHVKLVEDRVKRLTRSVPCEVRGVSVELSFLDWLSDMIKRYGVNGVPGVIVKDDKLYITREAIDAYAGASGKLLTLEDVAGEVVGRYCTVRVGGRVVRAVEVDPGKLGIVQGDS